MQTDINLAKCTDQIEEHVKNLNGYCFGVVESLVPDADYLTICSGGLVPKGSAPIVYPTAQQAVIAWKLAVNEYLIEHMTDEKRLYWRSMPKMDVFAITKEGAERSEPAIGYNVSSTLTLKSLLESK
jgi:hypothetical protein